VPGATDADYPATEAVKWDPNLEQTVEAHEADMSHGGPVHPSAQYVASSLPHLGSVGEMNSCVVRHGAIEWATTSKAIKEETETLYRSKSIVSVWADRLDRTDILRPNVGAC